MQDVQNPIQAEQVMKQLLEKPHRALIARVMVTQEIDADTQNKSHARHGRKTMPALPDSLEFEEEQNERVKLGLLIGEIAR